MRFPLLVICLLLLWPARAVAQVRPMRLAKPTARVARVPLHVQRNLLLVPVWLNGKGPFTFVLDTGVEMMLLTDPQIRDSLRLPEGQPLLVAGAGEEDPLRAALVAGVRVALPGVAEASLDVAVLSGDALELSRYVGEPVAGLIGADVFRSFVVEVRSGEGTLRLYDPDQFQPPTRRVARLPLLVVGGKPYVKAVIEQLDSTASQPDTTTARLIIDTGAGHALSIENRGRAPALRVPAVRRRAQVGRGLSGPISGWLGRVSALRLGPYRLRQLLASYPDSAAVQARVHVPRDGNLGYELLKRFQVWFDYPHAALWLRPGPHFRDPFEHDMSGLDIIAHAPSFSRFSIIGVEPGSPGEEAGLMPGDELLLIDGKPAASYSLTNLSQLLHAGDGRRIPLLVRRADGGFFYTLLHLRRII